MVEVDLFYLRTIIQHFYAAPQDFFCKNGSFFNNFFKAVQTGLKSLRIILNMNFIGADIILKINLKTLTNADTINFKSFTTNGLIKK